MAFLVNSTQHLKKNECQSSSSSKKYKRCEIPELILQGLQTPMPKPDKRKFSSVQFSRSVMSDSLQPHESQNARPSRPSPTPRVYPIMSIKSVIPSSHLIFCRPLLLLPPIPHSIRVFSNESTLHMR